MFGGFEERRQFNDPVIQAWPQALITQLVNLRIISQPNPCLLDTFLFIGNIPERGWIVGYFEDLADSS